MVRSRTGERAAVYPYAVVECGGDHDHPSRHSLPQHPHTSSRWSTTYIGTCKSSVHRSVAHTSTVPRAREHSLRLRLSGTSVVVCRSLALAAPEGGGLCRIGRP